MKELNLRILFILLWLSAFLVFSATDQKQKQWQRMKKLNSVIVGDPNWIPLLWLSNDPNKFYADLNFDEQINFVDYATYLRIKGL